MNWRSSSSPVARSRYPQSGWDYFVEKSRPPEIGEHNLVELDSVERQAVQTRAVRHVVVDGFGKRIRLLKHHTHTRPKLDHIDVIYVDVLLLKLDKLGNDD